MTETTAKPRSTLATVLFIFFAPALVCGTLISNLVLWFSNQMALMDASLEALATVETVGLALQAIFLCLLTGALWFFTHDTRYRPIYAGWFGAAALGLPAFFFHWLGPNNDLLGALLRFLLLAVVAALMFFVRRRALTWRWSALPRGLLVAALGALPLALFGALGSPVETFLHLLTGLALGCLAATWMATSTENFLLDSLGIGALLALLGSALGYDGGQLILLGLLPSFAFALAVLQPSFAATAAASGLLAAAGLMFFDPTELSLVLGDLTETVVSTVALTIALGWLLGAGLWAARKFIRPVPGWVTTALRVSAAVAWIVLIGLHLTVGRSGFYGDRLFVILKEQADISDVAAIKDRDTRLTEAYTRLTTHATTSQADLRKTFDTFHIAYTSYYLVNALEVEDGLLTRLYLSTRPEVDRVIPSPRLRPAPEAEPAPGEYTSVQENPGWNIRMIGADRVWEEFGVKGAGIVVGQSDTGVDGAHPALAAQYRGATEGDAYNWLDLWQGSSSPVDKQGHGTHTLGTILGAEGIGVAPAATWFACTNLGRNLGNPALYLNCLQFMLAPFPQEGDPFTDGDPTRAAHVINNSWGCPELEGCDPEALRVAAEHLRAAGVFVVASAGNDGPNCSTINSPLALYDAVFSVGAVDQMGDIAYFSSRGPVTADGSGRMKPDISAPGVDVFSAKPGGTYGLGSGTSMAGPHLVGVVALLWSANPDLIGDIDRTEQILIETADPYTGSLDAGCFVGEAPNAAYGYGLVNVYEAVKMALGK